MDVVGWRSCVCGGEHILIVLSLAVVEVVGGGEGEQRR